MRYRQLGTTGLRLSEIGFGCGPTSGLIVYGTRKERRDAVARALELGITHFDTAPTYGGARSEEHLGETLREIGVRPIIATKVGLTSAEQKADIATSVRRLLEASLQRLGLNEIDLFYVHSRVVEDDSEAVTDANSGLGTVSLEEVLGPGGIAETFGRLKEEGKVRAVGFSAVGKNVTGLYRIIESGQFDCAQMYHNILNPTAGYPPPYGFKAEDWGQTIPKAAAHGVGVVNIRALALGMLSGHDERHSEGLRERASRGDRGEDFGHADRVRAQALEPLAKADNLTLAQVALRYCLATPGVSTVLVGFTNVRQIEEAAAASDIGPLGVEEVSYVHSLHESDFGVAPR